ncbi:MAG: prepilin-type N-terminal cleavage/methylation domain-containing protein [Campylobacterota bacterium]|nr:prepilin-type N-terminal cleavage/methylation domain-containing protein [Campylobacterota bacterium]
MKSNKSKAFSLLEIIFAIAIISIIAIVAIPKLGNSLDKTNIIKIKSDIVLIRDGINRYKNQQILKADLTPLDTLEDDESLLFNKILTYPILSSNKQKSTTWNKLSDTKYIVWLDSEKSLEFIYDKVNYTFDCNKNDENCKEFTQ